MAAFVADDAPTTKMEGYLTCSICLETLKYPRTLACYHSFCMCCLAKFVKCQREKTEGKLIEEFNCPECRTVFQLKQEQSVKEMPRNHFVSNMLEVLEIQRRPNEITCTHCDRKPPAVSRCTTCEKYLCSECLSAHGKWFASQTHDLFTIHELTKPENQGKVRQKTRCKKHKNEIPQYYCETCKQLACIHCILLEHKEGHSYVSTKEVTEKKRELLKSSSALLHDQIKQGNNVLQQIDHVTQELTDNAKKVKDEISQQKQNILKLFTEKLEETTKVLVSEVDNKFNKTKECLIKQKAYMKSYVNKVEGPLELAKNLLEKGTDEEILSFQNDIDENAKNVESERPKMKPVHDGNIQYKANTVNNIDITRSLNKMGEVVCLAAKDPRKFPVCDNSTILNDHDDYGKQVMEWLGDQFQWRLCYRASSHGWSAQDFHRNCDDKGPTVTLVKVEDCIFGGYTDENWAGQGWKQSNSSFLFSLQNKDNLPSFKASVYQNHEYAIYSGPTWGPYFGRGADLYICNNSHAKKGSHSDFGNTYQPPAGYVANSEQTKSLLAGSYYFTPTDIEVFY